MADKVEIVILRNWPRLNRALRQSHLAEPLPKPRRGRPKKAALNPSMSTAAATFVASYNFVLKNRHMPGRGQRDIALAYAIQKKRLGRGKAFAAAHDVAQKWKRKIGTVKDAYSANHASVDEEIASILERLSGRQVMIQNADGSIRVVRLTSESILMAMWDDLLEELNNIATGRFASNRRKNPT